MTDRVLQICVLGCLALALVIAVLAVCGAVTIIGAIAGSWT